MLKVARDVDHCASGLSPEGAPSHLKQSLPRIPAFSLSEITDCLVVTIWMENKHVMTVQGPQMMGAENDDNAGAMAQFCFVITFRCVNDED